MMEDDSEQIFVDFTMRDAKAWVKSAQDQHN